MNRRQMKHHILVIVQKMRKSTNRHPNQIRGNHRLKRCMFAEYGIRFRSCRKALEYDSSKTMRARRKEKKC